jgi:hypothetical protein
MNLPFTKARPRIAAIICIRWALWLPLVAFVLYGLMLARYSAAYAGGADSSGYMNNARLLDHGSLITPMRQVPGLSPDTVSAFAYVPLGFGFRRWLLLLAGGLPGAILLGAVRHASVWRYDFPEAPP